MHRLCPAILIMWISSTEACAESSFLDEFRINRIPPSSNSHPVPPDSLLEIPPGSVETFADDPLPPSAEDVSAPYADFGPAGTPVPGICDSTSGACDSALVADNSPLIRYRATCFQGAQAAYGIIPASDTNGLGIKTLDLFGTFAVPLGSMDHVISFTPFFRQDQLNANSGLDVPTDLYETGVKSFWKKVIDERFTTMVLFTPSVRSDFQSSQEAFKLFGMALLQWHIRPDHVSLTGGAIYTGRQDYPVLPTMGIYWTPSPLWKLDIQFPSPRISRRLLKNGDQSETWGYLSGVFGGNTWAVKRSNGQHDQLTLRDLRLVLGVEHLLRENRGVFVETGWIFGRSMEFENARARSILATHSCCALDCSFSPLKIRCGSSGSCPGS
ncbi:MAG: DUF6268 family outer membrane beta-barrel protein [Planctomycetaceae bacterium]